MKLNCQLEKYFILYLSFALRYNVVKLNYLSILNICFFNFCFVFPFKHQTFTSLFSCISGVKLPVFEAYTDGANSEFVIICVFIFIR